MVIAFAGRRIDAPNAEPPRFPAGNVALVRERIRAELAGRDARVLVSSAACGADLLALDVAGELGIRRVVVLPWKAPRFRATSVVDRGADWGTMFDRILREVDPSDLRILDRAGDRQWKDEWADDAAYVVTNEAVLDTAADIARERATTDDGVALVAWNGKSRGPRDLTEAFMTAARRRRMKVVQIFTI